MAFRTPKFRSLTSSSRDDSGTKPILSDVEAGDIEGALKRGIAWVMTSQMASQGIRMLGVVLLARLLARSDYGAASLAVTIASYSMILGDLGYGTALVQSTAISQRSASTAFWAALAAGGLGFGLTAVIAYPAAHIIGTAEIAPLVLLGGSTLFLVGAGAASTALLTRSMKFGAIQAASLAALAVSTGAAVALAASGAGPWALVTQQALLAAVTSLSIIVIAGWRPSVAFSVADFATMSRFSLPITGGAIFFALQSIVTVLLVGKLEGVQALGVWTLSMSIVIVPLMLIAAPVAGVIYAGFARMRDRTDRVAEIWLSGMTLLAAVVLPALFGLIGVASDLIPLVFGAQWGPAAPIVQILCFLLMFRSLQTWNNSVMDAAGKPQVAMILNATLLVAIPPSIWMGSHFGLQGVAVFYVVATLVAGEIPSLIITTRELSVSVWDVVRRLRGVIAAAGLMLLAVLFVRSQLESAGVSMGPRIASSVAVGMAVYIGLLGLLAPHVATKLLQIAVAASPVRSPR